MRRPALGVMGWLRWGWRRLTRMPTALVLLALLALAAIPGGVLPQKTRNMAEVATYQAAHPALAPLLDRLGLFAVFTSPWFVALYLLLFISLLGCIAPRIARFARELRAPVPLVPASLERLDGHRVATSPLPPGQAAAAIASAAQGPGARLQARAAIRPLRLPEAGNGEGEEAPAAGREVTIVTGRAREAGNLVFHLGLVASLIALVAGQAFSHSGQIVLAEGRSAANSPVDYATFDSGLLFNPARLEPFTLRLDHLTTQFAAGGRPDFFEAAVTITSRGQASARHIRVNKPAQVAGTGIYLMGNGYAPRVSVTGPDGHVAFAGPVTFLVKDTAYTSDGVIKVPDLGPTQLGLQGQLYPSAVKTATGWASAGPQPSNPRLVLQAYTGDLGIDSGIPQDAFRLDTAKLTKAGAPIELGLGQSAQLPQGLGTIRFDSLPRYAAFDLTANPGAAWLLAAVLIASAGLIASLFLTRRRIYARITPQGPGSLIEVAGLSEGSDDALPRAIDAILGRAGAAGRAGARAMTGQAGTGSAEERTMVPGEAPGKRR